MGGRESVSCVREGEGGGVGGRECVSCVREGEGEGCGWERKCVLCERGGGRRVERGEKGVIASS